MDQTKSDILPQRVAFGAKRKNTYTSKKNALLILSGLHDGPYLHPACTGRNGGSHSKEHCQKPLLEKRVDFKKNVVDYLFSPST